MAQPLAIGGAKPGNSSTHFAMEIFSAPGSEIGNFLPGLLDYFNVNCLNKSRGHASFFPFLYIHVSFYMPLVDHSINHHWERRKSSMSLALYLYAQLREYKNIFNELGIFHDYMSQFMFIFT